MGIATNNTTRGAGIFLITVFFTAPIPNKMTKQVNPIIVFSLFAIEILFGSVFNNSIVPFPANVSGFIPKSKCNCFDMMIIPIAANIPCTTAEGNKSAYFPNLKTPKIT